MTTTLDRVGPLVQRCRSYPVRIGTPRRQWSRFRAYYHLRRLQTQQKRVGWRWDVSCRAVIPSGFPNPSLDESVFEDIIASPIVELDAAEDVKDVVYYTKWIYDCSVAKNMHEAEHAFVEMQTKGIEPNVFTYTSMMRGYYLIKDSAAVFAWYHRMRRRDVRPTLVTLGTLLAACALDGDVDRAVEFVKEFRNLGMEPDIVCFNALMQVCIRAGNLKLVNRVFHEIDQVKLKKTLVSYNTMINALAELATVEDKAAVLTRGFQLRDEIVQDGLLCDDQTYNGLIKLCIRVEEMERALDVLSQMKAARVQPDVVSYSMLIYGYAKLSHSYSNAGVHDRCTALLLEMEQLGITPNAHTYNSLMKVCERSGDHSKAVKIMEFMQLRGIEPDVVTYGTLIDCCAKHTDSQDANAYLRKCFGYVDDMRRRGLKPSCEIISALLFACARVRDIVSAERLIQYMKDEGIQPNGVVLTAFMMVYLKVDDVIGAKQCMAEMESLGTAPSIYAFNSLICWYAKEGMDREAFQMLGRMKKRGIQPDALTKRWLATVMHTS